MNDLDLNAKQRNVLAVIERNPEAVNNDMVLYERYWVEVDGWKPGESMVYCTRPETISRRRRELHNLGLIKYTDATDKVRVNAFKNEVERAAPRAVAWL